MDTTDALRVPSPDLAEAPANVPAVHSAGQVPATAPDNRRPTDPTIVLPHKDLIGNGTIAGALAAVMADIEGVHKGGTNTFHGYKYARMQDVLSELTPLLGKHGLVIFQTEHDRQSFDGDKVMAIQYRFTIAHSSGEVWPEHPLQTGVSYCRHVGGKSDGKFDDKSWNKCHTSARKYFLMALFQIPTDDETDADGEQREKTVAPVPGPTGYVPPHRLDPIRNEKFPAWSARYQAAIGHSKTVAELMQWDNANDDLLSQLAAGDNDLYSAVLQTTEKLRAALTVTTGPETTAKQAGAADPVPGPLTQETPATIVEAAAPFVRPEGCPDPDKDPDAFVIWAQKRMDAINGADELSLIWENEITPASDGLFKPDCDALDEYYNARLEKLGA